MTSHRVFSLNIDAARALSGEGVSMFFNLRNRIPRVAFECGVCVLVAACNSRSKNFTSSTASVEPSPAPTSVASANTTAARPIYPQSGATLLGSNVLFRWSGVRAQVELAREREFKIVVKRLPASPAQQAVLHLDRGIWFWRVVEENGRASAVWGFDVTANSATAHAPSLLLGADYNGDLFADLSVKYGVVLGRAGKLPDRPITALDVGTAKAPELTRAATDQPYTWDFPESAGDVNGDGYADMTAQVARQSSTRLDDDVPVRLFFEGRAGIQSLWAASGRINHRASAIGDLNDDGYADVADCGGPKDSRCLVFAGGPSGLRGQPLLELPQYQSLLGGVDLNGDDYSDLIGVTKDGLLAFYAGPLNAAPLAPTRTWKVPPASSAFVGLVDLDADGRIDIWGKGSRAIDSSPGFSEARVWMIPGKDIAVDKPPRVLGSFKREVNDDMAFIPGVGKRGVGILVRSTDVRNDFAFLQESFPFPLRPFTGVDAKLRSDLSETSLQSIGDFNGDGYDDLLVTRASAAEDVVSEVYLGGAKSFTLHPASPLDSADPLSGGFMSGGPARFPF